ncbi:ABC transporter ATP-binding protein [Streptomyces sp. NRRL F-4474]|uniref:oligopeptide/dipeptide ABC transporter ATP-binding protein n=1 Tax=Streptomyces sp. NRRL F-4474 TaxID=1463851 RepID=UPI0004C65E7E|nr:ABC transporter ATP-binding protein [Streptomyces sp. NRRL F-4474]
MRVEGLSVRFRMAAGRYVEAVTEAAFALAPGESLALVGESGCGKSVLASALLGLLPANAETAGSALLADGLDLLAADERTLARTVRGRRVGLVPQSPAAHLTPVRTVRSQLEETVRELAGTTYAGHTTQAPAAEPRPAQAGPPPASGASDRPARRGRRHRLAALRAAAEAAAGRAAFPASHLDRHPHELSGGLAQRAATALALVGDAPLLLADEPTTGLDRDLVLRTADELRAHTRADGRALLLITHDLAAAERIADTVAVMYAGRIVEIAPAGAFFGSPGPRHPYARGLLDALPERAFTPVPGAPPELGALPPGCAFAARCAAADPLCRTRRPALTEGVACHHA